MIALIALNNPDPKYKSTRHNLGRLVLEFWIKGHDLAQPKLDKKLDCYLTPGTIHNQKVLVGWPSLYMNESGIAIRQIAKRYKLKPEQVWILHDDIDIKFGKLKIAQNRGPAGHHGVESVIKSLGTKNFIRFRFGIQPEKGSSPTFYRLRSAQELNGRQKVGDKPKNIDQFVLQQFTDKEKVILTKKLPEFAIALDKHLKNNM